MRGRRRETRTNEGLILNSLVDIALSLVIGFMVSMPFFFENGIFVSAPSTARAAADQAGSTVTANIYITNDGRVMLNESQIDEHDLLELIPRLLNRTIDRRVYISNDDSVAYSAVIRIMDLVKRADSTASLAWLRTRRRQQ
ncbi:MAG: biopolymer transporter ExbD [candidate division WOR-3 bacterium]